MTRLPPQVRHRKAFTAVSADEEICRTFPAAESDASDWQICFAWCRLPRVMKTKVIHMELRAIL
eukprot:6199439-Pleurochrysis_carterae.AAC.1